MTEHKHAALLRAIADEGVEAADDFECMRLGWTCPNWALASPYLSQLTREPELWQVRRKAKMIKIGDVEFPEPVREPLKFGERYFLTSLFDSERFSHFIWKDDLMDHRWLQRGLIHLTEEAAKHHAEALVKLSGGTV